MLFVNPAELRISRFAGSENLTRFFRHNSFQNVQLSGLLRMNPKVLECFQHSSLDKFYALQVEMLLDTRNLPVI
jgi:hypothetical protein